MVGDGNSVETRVNDPTSHADNLPKIPFMSNTYRVTHNGEKAPIIDLPDETACRGLHSKCIPRPLKETRKDAVLDSHSLTLLSVSLMGLAGVFASLLFTYSIAICNGTLRIPSLKV